MFEQLATHFFQQQYSEARSFWKHLEKSKSKGFKTIMNRDHQATALFPSILKVKSRFETIIVALRPTDT